MAAAFSSYSHSTVPSILFRAITVDLLALPVMFTVKITRPEMPFWPTTGLALQPDS